MLTRNGNQQQNAAFRSVRSFRRMLKLVVGCLLMVGAAGLSSCSSVTYSTSLPPPSPEGRSLSVGVLQETNHARRSNGLSPLASNAALAKAAEDQARFLVANVPLGGVMSKATAHHDFGDRSVAVMRANSMTSTAEIVAAMPRGQSAPANVVRVWLASPGHRGKVLGAWSQAGAGAARAADGTWFVVEWFGNFR